MRAATSISSIWGKPGPPIPAGPQSTANAGSVVELMTNGTARVLASGLNFPNGIVLATDGLLYLSVGSTCPEPFPYCSNGGQIIQLRRP